MKFQVLRSYRDAKNKEDENRENEMVTIRSGSIVDLPLQMVDPTLQVKADDTHGQERIIELLTAQKISFIISESALAAYNSEFKALLDWSEERQRKYHIRTSRIPLIYEIYIRKLAEAGYPRPQPRVDSDKYPIELVALKNFRWDVGRVAHKGDLIRATVEEAAELVSCHDCDFAGSPEKRSRLYVWLEHRHRLWPESEPYRFLERNLALNLAEAKIAATEAALEKERQEERQRLPKKESSKSGKSR